MYEGNSQALSAFWADLTKIAEASKHLGQFPFGLLSKMVREMSELFDTPEFDSLYELVVDVQRQRVSDGEAAESFRLRGRQKLGNEKPYEAIRWLGVAEELFVKEEYQRQLILHCWTAVTRTRVRVFCGPLGISSSWRLMAPSAC